MSNAEAAIDNGVEEDTEMVEEGAEGNGEGNGDMGGLETIDPDVPTPETFANALRSPIVEITVGTGSDATALYAHKLLLQKSSYLADLIQTAESQTGESKIALTDDVSATSSALEFLYKNDYFPTLLSHSSLEPDPTIPQPDTTGVALLRHARVYTLAKLLKLPSLATLAHRKIHLVESTARGEIAYARYVYGNTREEDKEIRKPVAQFWATRSHVLRHEAEQEFRDMCLSFPQFGFDVLSMVLDAHERRTGKSESVGPGRKRQRVSQG